MNAPFPLLRVLLACSTLLCIEATAVDYEVRDLSCEYLTAPIAIESPAPRLSWRIESPLRGQRQTAYRVLVASDLEHLDNDSGDLWDSGLVASALTVNIAYAGMPLGSRQECLWKVQSRDRDGHPSAWSAPARWRMGLLTPGDWQAQWISVRDPSPVHRERDRLFLPPARQYRREFTTNVPVRRAILYVSALGTCDLQVNGAVVAETFLEPGWSDYRKRAYYRVHDVTALVKTGANCLGAVVADGWYAGYVGYALLVGDGPYKAGRCLYGKTPALLAQLELEFTDSSHAIIASDANWSVTSAGPMREADILMGETYDARLEQPGWGLPGTALGGWEPAIRAEDNGSWPVPFFDNSGERQVDLAFQRPPRMQAYPAPPIRVIREVHPKRIVEQRPGIFIADLGENIAGTVRLHLAGAAGTAVRIRYGEMLHPDGRLMTENLRRARATDTYILRGDPAGETWTPRFTYHGFQYIELAGLPSPPQIDAITALVLHNDTRPVGEFACSDTLLNQLFANIARTQFANFIEVPTDCPQRDERLGWMGDAQIYIRSATYVADVAAFFTKWLDDVDEAQLPSGAFPDYCPYPMGHGLPGKSFGTAWTDAGIICPWTIWQAYGDTRVIERHWAAMTRFMAWRRKSSPDLHGISIGNTWGDWLNFGEDTPIPFIDAAYYARDAELMAAMAEAIGHAEEATAYRELHAGIISVFRSDFLKEDGALAVDTQTAYVLALSFGLLPAAATGRACDHLAARIAANGYRMSTGFLGTKPLLPVLSAGGKHSLAVKLFQSRSFPSWGYEVANGATSVWERWDSYTKEDAFGRHNAAMNSFSHYSFGAVCEWMFRDLAGIDADQPGFRHLRVRPGTVPPGSDGGHEPIAWVTAAYAGINGRVASSWRRDGGRFELTLTVPTNSSATVFLPCADLASVSESGHPLAEVQGATLAGFAAGWLELALDSGTYHLASRLGP
jgi:alpha-L-rhamnosidase